MTASVFDISLKNKVVNGIELYSVSRAATETYQREAKQARNMSNEELEYKLTAIVMASDKIGSVNERIDVYRFGGFIVTVDTKTHKINTICWRRDNHIKKASKTQVARLVESYKLLGLNNDGRLIC